jgi:protoheme IX farnesyltransferase
MSQMVSGLIRASHPEPAVAVTTMAALLAWGVGHRPAGVVAVAAVVLASQLAVGWTNDRIDADRDTLVDRTGKPLVQGVVSRRTVTIAGLAATGATLLLALLTLDPVAATWVGVALSCALLYNWPLKSSPVSVLPYAVSFGALPAAVILALPGRPDPPVWLVGAAALLGAGAHFANVLPDLADDARTGVRGLPHRIGPAGSRIAAAGLLLAATGVLVVGPPGPPSPIGLAAAGTAALVLPLGWYGAHVATRRGARPVAIFRAVMLVAVIDVVLLVTSGGVS